MIIQTLWVGDRFSQVESLSARSFLANGHEYHLYSYCDIADVPPGVVRRDAREILPEDRVFSYKKEPGRGSVSAFSNIFRYKLLHDRGGVWVDTDVVCLKPFDFRTPYIFGQERAQNRDFYVASCVLATPAGSDFAATCWLKSESKNQDELAWGEIGPELVTKTVLDLKLTDCVLPPTAFCPSDWWLAKQEITGPQGRAVDISASYAVHLWNETWRRNGIPKSGHYHPDSLYTILSGLYPTYVL